MKFLSNKTAGKFLSDSTPCSVGYATRIMAVVVIPDCYRRYGNEARI